MSGALGSNSKISTGKGPFGPIISMSMSRIRCKRARINANGKRTGLGAGSEHGREVEDFGKGSVSENAALDVHSGAIAGNEVQPFLVVDN